MCRVNSYKANYRQHVVHTSNYIMNKDNIKSKTNYRQVLEEKHIKAEKQANEQTNKLTNKQAIKLRWEVTRITNIMIMEK
jgi:hypothetical protein